MADNAETSKKKSITGYLVLGAVIVVAAAAGLVAPTMLLGGRTPQTPEKKPRELALVPFDEIVVNLHSEKLTRFLRIKITVVVDKTDETVLKEQVDKKKAFLRSWTIGFLSDQTVESLRGAVGYNRVRRQLRDLYNARLFPDGPDRILDLLFEEFNIQ